MRALVSTATCSRCEWTAGPGDPADVDRAAEKHTNAARHPTAVKTRYADAREVA